jgi:hypothetical protein
MLAMRRAALAAAVLLSLTACSDDEPGLFDGQAPATPNVLHGVYNLDIDDAGATIQVRLKFRDGSIDGGVRCTSKANGQTLEATGSVPLSADLNAATGSFTIEALVLQKDAPPFFCQAGLRAGKYDFKVEELRLTLNQEGVVTPLIYAKVGD